MFFLKSMDKKSDSQSIDSNSSYGNISLPDSSGKPRTQEENREFYNQHPEIRYYSQGNPIIENIARNNANNSDSFDTGHANNTIRASSSGSGNSNVLSGNSSKSDSSNKSKKAKAEIQAGKERREDLKLDSNSSLSSISNESQDSDSSKTSRNKKYEKEMNKQLEKNKKKDPNSLVHITDEIQEQKFQKPFQKSVYIVVNQLGKFYVIDSVTNKQEGPDYYNKKKAEEAAEKLNKR